jgi:putative transposase
MKRSKLSEAQIAFVLKQADDGTTIGEVCRKAGSATRPSMRGARSTPG